MYYPTLAFISLVFKTSTGLPIIQAVIPATADETRWHGTPSSIRFLLIIMSLTWSNVAIYAALIIEFLIMLGPRPVQRPATLKLRFKIPFLCDDFSISVSNCFVSSLMFWFFSLTLESDFYNISWICNHNSKGSSC